MDKKTVLEKLREFNLFEGLDEEQIELIYQSGNVVSLAAGEIIVNEGQTDHDFHIVLSGEMDIILPKVAEDFERISEVKLGVKTEGDCVGEYSFVDGRPASASVVARGECYVFVLDRNEFRQILDSNDAMGKGIYLNMLKMLADNIRMHDERSDTFILV